MQGGWCSGENLRKEIRKDWTTTLDNGRFLIGMEEESVFGRTFGVGRRLWAGLSRPCLTWLSIKMLWSGMFGTVLGKEEVGSLALIDL